VTCVRSLNNWNKAALNPNVSWIIVKKMAGQKFAEDIEKKIQEHNQEKEAKKQMSLYQKCIPEETKLYR
jgi:predicted Holliday junction resolvase-like endonuclease